MPHRIQNLTPFAAGTLSLAAILIIICGAFLALSATAWREFAGVSHLFSPYFLRVITFTLWQALWSTVLSLAAAIPLAMALARRQNFTGRSLLLKLFALPLALPALVAVLGIVEIWGRSGWFNAIASGSGWDAPLNIYGLTGILIAHVFFNLPLAARLLLVHFDRIPAETWRLAAQLGLPPRTIFKLIEWPAVRQALPGIATLVFMLCIASFTVVLTLGGGPRATTIEVAIYQSLRFDFDPARAVMLALIQLALCTALVVIAGRFTTDMHASPALGRKTTRPDAGTAVSRITDTAIIAAAGLFVILPMLAIVIGGLLAGLPKLLREPLVWHAITTSAVIAAASALLCICAAWSLATAARAQDNSPRLARFFTTASGISGNLILVAPPIVLGAGWFILLRHYSSVSLLAPLMVVTINALMALPFALRILAPAVRQSAKDHDRLCASLGVAGWSRFKLIDLPILLRPLTLAIAFAAALSIGDLGVIALFGSEDFTTLPFLLYQRFGSYRIDDAAGLALILMIFCLGLVAAAEWFARPGQLRDSQ